MERFKIISKAICSSISVFTIVFAIGTILITNYLALIIIIFSTYSFSLSLFVAFYKRENNYKFVLGTFLSSFVTGVAFYVIFFNVVDRVLDVATTLWLFSMPIFGYLAICGIVFFLFDLSGKIDRYWTASLVSLPITTILEILIVQKRILFLDEGIIFSFVSIASFFLIPSIIASIVFLTRSRRGSPSEHYH